MHLRDTRVLLTGATGGIGSALARQLAAHGAKLGLVGTRSDALKQLAASLRQLSNSMIAITADITMPEGQALAISAMQSKFGGIDILINNAGVTDFTEFAAQDPQTIANILTVNTIAPMQLTRLVLPEMLKRNQGQIVNIGSIFGSIGFPCFSSYSASKFALRGFSEGLRRELATTAVTVTYLAPRAVKTALNNDAVMQMAAKIRMNMDDPEIVAEKLVTAIIKNKKEVLFGNPERFFARLNQVLPRLVDGALQKQHLVMRNFTRRAEKPRVMKYAAASK